MLVAPTAKLSQLGHLRQAQQQTVFRHGFIGVSKVTWTRGYWRARNTQCERHFFALGFRNVDRHGSGNLRLISFGYERQVQNRR